jgi:hypothetical protein
MGIVIVTTASVVTPIMSLLAQTPGQAPAVYPPAAPAIGPVAAADPAEGSSSSQVPAAVAKPRVSKARRAYTEAFTVPDLRAQCKARGLPHTGVKAVLVDRIVNSPVKVPPDYGDKLKQYMNL